MKRLWLQILKWWYELWINGKFNEAVSLKLDKIITELEGEK